MTLAADDRRFLWHPFMQQRGSEDEAAPTIERADGVFLWDTEGRRYIDGVSSLWCNVHGHRHPVIDIAVKDQLDKVAHTTMFGLSHPTAVELAKRLVELAPPGLSRVFYSDSGSTAAEIALKMAFLYWRQRGGEEARRTRFVCLPMSYHGDTFDALRAEPGDAADMERVLAENEGEVAAVIVEPLVQGAAGMLVHPEAYLRDVRELCDRYGTLLICDEVATGFGRTGRMFACEHEGVTPDLMCLAKGLTAGYMPLAATLATERIYEGFLGGFEEFRTFSHGHTYTGNPLACAAALASLRLFEQERTLETLGPKSELLGRLLEPIAALPTVAEVRRRGFMVGIELTEFPLESRMGHQVTLEARRRGAIVHPLDDVVILMPPLSIRPRELRDLVEITGEAIEAATGAAAPQRAAA